jgi:Fe2+ transport system protein B
VKQRPLVIEFLGLPASGKSTLSHAAADALRRHGMPVAEPTYVADHLMAGGRRYLHKLGRVSNEVLCRPRGAASVLVFLPQIAILFLLLGILEDTGYMARAALLMDRLMRAVGLPGRSVIPLISGYACAVPGIMSTRTIADPHDRLATIMVLPLTSCSARLPVYTLLIGAFVPATLVGGVLDLRGVTLFSMYALGTVMDFHELEPLVDAILAPLHNRHLNEVPPFIEALNPSAENVAFHVARSLNLPARVRLERVEVWETDDNSSVYRL